MKWVLSLIFIAVSSVVQAEGTALIISDNRSVETSWHWCLTDESLGLTLQRITTCYDCHLTTDRGMATDVARIVSNNTLTEHKPDVVFLQLGCNDVPDTDSTFVAYESSLFDYPYGKVCTLTGTNPRTKQIAISKDKARITNSNFAGSVYRIVSHIREQVPGARLFFLAPVKYGSMVSAADSLRLAQLRRVCNMLCIPFVDDWQTVRGYDFIWKQTRPHLGRVLLLGDSYSGLRKWTAHLERFAVVDELTNLGKTSATLKERGGTHTNTLGSQLDRIPTTCRPDIILIEGGINDEADQQRFVNTYADCIANQKRTTFAGALAYITTKLRARFPKAQIYVVTPGGLYYGHTDHPFDFIVKADQIRLAAQLLGIPTIDWDREGRLSFVFNNSRGTGDGSEARPFIYNVPSAETGDLLHPNDVGAVYLAENVVKELRKQ